MAEKPRVLAINQPEDPTTRVIQAIGNAIDLSEARSVTEAMGKLNELGIDAVLLSVDQFNSFRTFDRGHRSDPARGDQDRLAIGIALFDPNDRRIRWASRGFWESIGLSSNPVGKRLDELPGIEQNDKTVKKLFDSLIPHAFLKTKLHLTIDTVGEVWIEFEFLADVPGSSGGILGIISETRGQREVEQKIAAINSAGEELADLSANDLARLTVEERINLLKRNIVRHMRDLFGLDFIEIRLLHQSNGRLDPLLTEGMIPLAADRMLIASTVGNGVTGFVAATGQTYLCSDTTQDPLYLEGAANARSALTLPLLRQGTVLGTLNVESPKPHAFDQRDQQFLEIYCREIAAALTTLELLEAERVSTATASTEAIAQELALPLDEILNDVTTALDHYEGDDPEVSDRLLHLLSRAREIRGLIRSAGRRLLPETAETSRSNQRLAGASVLVVDADHQIRSMAHQLLEEEGATVETARDAREATALARQSSYGAALVDIRLPDCDGYHLFKRLREIQPGIPVILVTGFGYDPTHSIVRARMEGLRNVLYKPFHVDRLVEAIEQSIQPGAAQGTLESQAP